MVSESKIDITAQHFVRAAKGLRRSVGADIPVQQMMILVYLWEKDGCNQMELVYELDLKKAAASRHCRSLSTYTVQQEGQPEEKGQRLIIAERSPNSGREMRYRLTDQAREIVSRFVADLAGAGMQG